MKSKHDKRPVKANDSIPTKHLNGGESAGPMKEETMKEETVQGRNVTIFL